MRVYQAVATGNYDIARQQWTILSKNIYYCKDRAEADGERLRKLLDGEDTLFGNRTEIKITITEPELFE